MATALLHLLHLADSGLPIGAHAFSHGLETLIATGAIRGAGDVEALFHAVLSEGLGRCELVALLAAHEAAGAGAHETIAGADGLLAALTPVAEWRAASSRMARRLLATVRPLATHPALEAYAAWVDEGVCHGQHPLAVALAGAALGVEARPVALAYAYGETVNRLSAAVRLLPLGQTAAQAILHRLKPAMEQAVAQAAGCALADMAPSLPALEIAGMAHAHATTRLFAS